MDGAGYDLIEGRDYHTARQLHRYKAHGGNRLLRRQVVFSGAAAAFGGSACNSSAIADYCSECRVAVRVDGRDYTGTSVFRTRWHERDGLLPGGSRFRRRIWAEAPIVDLGARGLLFGLLTAPVQGKLLPANVLAEYAVNLGSRYGADALEALREIPRTQRAFILRQSDWPTFVRFSDLSNPASVEEITPSNITLKYTDDSEIRQVAMRVVEGAPTRRILEVLPWLRGLETNLAGGGSLHVRGAIAERLSATHFMMWNQEF